VDVYNNELSGPKIRIKGGNSNIAGLDQEPGSSKVANGPRIGSTGTNS
jgi:hypothetical protein